jgi:hypothetical protein
MFDLNKANRDIYDLCEYIEQYQALRAISPGYINDPVDVDKEDCFV